MGFIVLIILFYFFPYLAVDKLNFFRYLGRKILNRYHSREELDLEIQPIENHGIKTPSYTYWTISYALTLDGDGLDLVIYL